MHIHTYAQTATYMCTHTYTHTFSYNGGARIVMVIIVRNGISNASSNPGQSQLYFTLH